MKEIKDAKKLEIYLEEQRLHFQQPLQLLKLVQFEKGELLTGPLHPLKSFYIVV